jgi:hypothetical protein
LRYKTIVPLLAIGGLKYWGKNPKTAAKHA